MTEREEMLRRRRESLAAWRCKVDEHNGMLKSRLAEARMHEECRDRSQSDWQGDVMRQLDNELVHGENVIEAQVVSSTGSLRGPASSDASQPVNVKAAEEHQLREELRRRDEEIRKRRDSHDAQKLALQEQRVKEERMIQEQRQEAEALEKEAAAAAARASAPGGGGGGGNHRPPLLVPKREEAQGSTSPSPSRFSRVRRSVLVAPIRQRNRSSSPRVSTPGGSCPSDAPGRQRGRTSGSYDLPGAAEVERQVQPQQQQQGPCAAASGDIPADVAASLLMATAAAAQAEAGGPGCNSSSKSSSSSSSKSSSSSSGNSKKPCSTSSASRQDVKDAKGSSGSSSDDGPVFSNALRKFSGHRGSDEKRVSVDLFEVERRSISSAAPSPSFNAAAGGVFRTASQAQGVTGGPSAAGAAAATGHLSAWLGSAQVDPGRGNGDSGSDSSEEVDLWTMTNELSAYD
eukprot:TRINITY_DN623_c0_g1_i3.p1 TRINITY_DN623_c0_g1~~TRINITY_DN623_c0_g1_i3.p1  ORF type:complete len:459 (-),score=98.42 TRINITY_DN623_c0_g1_i3:12-1388(-)